MKEILRRQRITADKREIKDFLKLPSATFFIRKRQAKCRFAPFCLSGSLRAGKGNYGKWQKIEQCYFYIFTFWI